MSLRRPRLLAVSVMPFVALLCLTACSGGAGGSTEVGTEPPATFTAPEWSVDIEPVGDWLTSVANDDLRIDIYQVGVADAPEDSAWAFEETDEPLFVAGDPVVVLQYILTNTSDEQLVLSSGKADDTANYTSLDLSSVPPESRFGETIESFGISPDGPIDFESDYTGIVDNSWDMPVEPGESVAWPQVYLYLPDGGFTLRFRVWPYADGEFDFGTPAFDSDDIDISLN